MCKKIHRIYFTINKKGMITRRHSDFGKANLLPQSQCSLDKRNGVDNEGKKSMETEQWCQNSKARCQTQNTCPLYLVLPSEGSSFHLAGSLVMKNEIDSQQSVSCTSLWSLWIHKNPSSSIVTRRHTYKQPYKQLLWELKKLRNHSHIKS